MSEIKVISGELSDEIKNYLELIKYQEELYSVLLGVPVK
jgi:hypothetical protein